MFPRPSISHQYQHLLYEFAKQAGQYIGPSHPPFALPELRIVAQLDPDSYLRLTAAFLEEIRGWSRLCKVPMALFLHTSQCVDGGDEIAKRGHRGMIAFVKLMARIELPGANEDHRMVVLDDEMWEREWAERDSL